MCNSRPTNPTLGDNLFVRVSRLQNKCVPFTIYLGFFWRSIGLHINNVTLAKDHISQQSFYHGSSEDSCCSCSCRCCLWLRPCCPFQGCIRQVIFVFVGRPKSIQFTSCCLSSSGMLRYKDLTFGFVRSVTCAYG